VKMRFAGWTDETKNNNRTIYRRVWHHAGLNMSIAICKPDSPLADRCRMDSNCLPHTVQGPTLKSLLVWWVSWKLEGKK
jgi:hypothetical protein